MKLDDAHWADMANFWAKQMDRGDTTTFNPKQGKRKKKEVKK